MPQGECQRLQSAVKADDAQRTGQIRSGAQDGHRIGGSTETNIPDDELAHVRLQPLPETELLDIQRLRLGHGTDDGMKRLLLRQRADAAGSVFQTNELVILQKHMMSHQSDSGRSR